MKTALSKTAVFSLILTMVAASIVCCCLTDVLAAHQGTASCHQTEDTDKHSSGKEECNCDNEIATVEKTQSFEFQRNEILAFLLENKISHTEMFTIASHAYQAPPQITDSTPLFIKHSTLRI